MMYCELVNFYYILYGVKWCHLNPVCQMMEQVSLHLHLKIISNL